MGGGSIEEPDCCLPAVTPLIGSGASRPSLLRLAVLSSAVSHPIRVTLSVPLVAGTGGQSRWIVGTGELHAIPLIIMTAAAIAGVHMAIAPRLAADHPYLITHTLNETRHLDFIC